MTTTETPTTLAAKVASARERLDAHVRETVAWHFDPATGTPFWLEKAKTLGFDPRREVRGFDDLRIHQPALFVAGEREPVLAMMAGAAEAMKDTVPGLRDVIMLPGCGHWTQQERPAEVNEAES